MEVHSIFYCLREALKTEGKTQLEQALKLLECSSSTFYRRIKAYEEEQYRQEYDRLRKTVPEPGEQQDFLIDF